LRIARKEKVASAAITNSASVIHRKCRVNVPCLRIEEDLNCTLRLGIAEREGVTRASNVKRRRRGAERALCFIDCDEAI